MKESESPQIDPIITLPLTYNQWFSEMPQFLSPEFGFPIDFITNVRKGGAVFVINSPMLPLVNPKI
jgi:hypothetical protein